MSKPSLSVRALDPLVIERVNNHGFAWDWRKFNRFRCVYCEYSAWIGAYVPIEKVEQDFPVCRKAWMFK